MKISSSPSTFLLVFILLAPLATLAQQVLPDSIVYENALASTSNKAMRSLKKINNGNEYIAIAYSLKHGHPFFATEHIQSGSLTYYGVDYANVDFQFDLITNKLVLEHVSGRKISLINEKVSHFILDGKLFRRIDANQRRITPGFYQFLVDGEHVQLIALHKKKIDGYDRNRFPYIASSTDYYVVKDNEYTFVRNYKSIVKLLGENDELSAAVGKNRSASDEEKMVAVVQHYERLKK